MNNIDYLILDLKDNFLLEREDDVAGFLGLQIERDKQRGKITLTQTGLIDRILECMLMQDSNIKYTPADKLPVGKDEHGPPYIEK